MANEQFPFLLNSSQNLNKCLLSQIKWLVVQVAGNSNSLWSYICYSNIEALKGIADEFDDSSDWSDSVQKKIIFASKLVKRILLLVQN